VKLALVVGAPAGVLVVDIFRGTVTTTLEDLSVVGERELLRPVVVNGSCDMPP